MGRKQADRMAPSAPVRPRRASTEPRREIHASRLTLSDQGQDVMLTLLRDLKRASEDAEDAVDSEELGSHEDDEDEDAEDEDDEADEEKSGAPAWEDRDEFEYDDCFAKMANDLAADQPPPRPSVSDEARARYEAVRAEERAERDVAKEKKRLLHALVREEREVAARAVPPAPPPGARAAARYERDGADAPAGGVGGKTVRVVLCADGDKGSGKLVVLARAPDVKELLTTAKNKLRLKKRPLVAFRLGRAGVRVLVESTAALVDDATVYVSTRADAQDDITAPPPALPPPVATPAAATDAAAVAESARVAAVAEKLRLTYAARSAAAPGRDGVVADGAAAGAGDDATGDDSHQARRAAACAAERETAAKRGQDLRRRRAALCDPMNARGRELLERRAQLPAWSAQGEVLAALDRSDCLVVTGETGCGKSTQVGQFILDAAVDADGGGALGITCTQPRRVAAIALAERVASERDENPGDVIGSVRTRDHKAGGLPRGAESLSRRRDAPSPPFPAAAATRCGWSTKARRAHVSPSSRRACCCALSPTTARSRAPHM